MVVGMDTNTDYSARPIDQSMNPDTGQPIERVLILESNSPQHQMLEPGIYRTALQTTTVAQVGASIVGHRFDRVVVYDPGSWSAIQGAAHWYMRDVLARTATPPAEQAEPCSLEQALAWAAQGVTLSVRARRLRHEAANEAQRLRGVQEAARPAGVPATAQGVMDRKVWSTELGREVPVAIQELRERAPSRADPRGTMWKKTEGGGWEKLSAAPVAAERIDPGAHCDPALLGHPDLSTPAAILAWAAHCGAVDPVLVEESPGWFLVGYPTAKPGFLAEDPEVLTRLFEDHPHRWPGYRGEFRRARDPVT